MLSARRLAVALCMGMAVFLTLEDFLPDRHHVTQVVAARSIERGQTIQRRDVTTMTVPASAWKPAANDAEQIIGRVAQIDIVAGDWISTNMARDSPIIPIGTTVLEVRLASDPDQLMPGDHVRLASTMGCEGDECLLSGDALVMSAPSGGDTTQRPLDAESTTMAFALPPEDAARVMRLQQTGAIVAVMR